MNPQPTPVPIHDIAAPVPFFPYPIWMLVAGGVLVLAVIALLVWLIFFRKRPVKLLSPHERAIAELTVLRSEVAGADPYVFSIRVSDVLREFLRDAHGLEATTQTSMEFLEAVRARNAFSFEEQAALSAFLEKADLIKFARMHAGEADCRELLDRATQLVRQTKKEEQAA